MKRSLPADDILRWYEANLPLPERKSRGHFSTPPLLVEQILDACQYTSDNDITQMRVLDPACGSGNFLAGATRRLIDAGLRLGFVQKELSTLLQRNLWGFDPDPVACFLAEMQLGDVAAQGLTPKCMPKRLHVHQADGLALPWEAYEGVDVFVANPPYLAAKNTDLSGYQTAHQRGQADSYLLFLNLALQIVRPHGWIGLVLPDPVLARVNAAKERTRLLENCTIHHLWHLSGVFAAQVGAVVIIAQKCPAKSMHQVTWVREKWERNSEAQQTVSTGHTQHIAQSLFLCQPRAEFRYLLSEEQGPTIERLRSYMHEKQSSSCRRLAPLSEFLSICRGEELGRESEHLVEGGQLQGSNVGAQFIAPVGGCTPAAPCVVSHTSSPNEGAIHCAPTMTRSSMGSKCRGNSCGYPDCLTNASAWYPVLRGGTDIRPYGTPNGRWSIAREAVTKPLERYVSPKLLVVKSTGRLQAVLDTQGHVVLQTLYLLHLYPQKGNEDDLYFFLALLNSRLLKEYVYVLHTAYKWVQPQIEQHVLAQLPIPVVKSDVKQEIIEQAKLMMQACRERDPVVEWEEHMQSLYEAQERAICALYASALPGLFCE